MGLLIKLDMAFKKYIYIYIYIYIKLDMSLKNKLISY